MRILFLSFSQTAVAAFSLQFKPGDKVFGVTGQQAFWSTYGTYAEYVSAHESTLQPIPSQLSFQEAAAVPLAAMTAWQAMEPSMPLQGKRVLVHAGAGGVSYLVECIAECLALLLPAHVLLHSFV
jgi:NADPH:quinone reductase-like Zn-dependent oxidoreductase